MIGWEIHDGCKKKCRRTTLVSPLLINFGEEMFWNKRPEREGFGTRDLME
jgi:hypothetical protein